MRLYFAIFSFAFSQVLSAQCITVAPVPGLCNGNLTHQLVASPSGGVWSGNQVSPSGLINTSNLFGLQFATYIYSDANCTDTVTISYQVHPSPGVAAGTDFTIVCGNIAHLVGAFTPGPNSTASWSTNDGHIVGSVTDMNPPIDQPGTYVLTAINNGNGCARRDTVVCYPYLPSFPNTQIEATICLGDTLLGYTSNGIYYEKYETGSACDSFRVVRLTVLPPLRDTVVSNICAGESVAGYEVSGVYRDTFAAVNGCDSIRVLDLTVLPGISTNLASTTCDPDQAGIFETVLAASNGCDSTVINTVTLLPTSNSAISATICSGETFEGYDASGFYTDIFVNQFGCDSIRVLDLTVLELPSVESEISADNGVGTGSITVMPLTGNQPFVYNWSTGDTTAVISGLSSGDYVLTLTDADGCSDVLTFTVPLSVGIFEMNDSPIKLLASPNPAGKAERINFSLTTTLSGEYFVSVFDAAGKLIRQFAHVHFGHSSAFDLQFREAGVYIVRLTDSKGLRSQVKIVVGL